MINRLKEQLTIVPVEVLENKELSLAAKGLFAFLCSKQDYKNLSLEDLSKFLKEKEKTVRNLLKELEKHSLI